MTAGAPSARDELFINHLHAFTFGLSRHEVHAIRSLVELTREIEYIDREFTAQMLSMEHRMAGALVNYSNSLVAATPGTDPQALSPSTSSASASASDDSPTPGEPSRPPLKAGPSRLVNDLALLDSGELAPRVPSYAVGSALRDDAGSPLSTDLSMCDTNSDTASPLICTPDLDMGVATSDRSITPLDSVKPSDLESLPAVPTSN